MAYRTFLRIAFFFITGILLGIYFPMKIPIRGTAAFLLSASIVLVVLSFLRGYFRQKGTWTFLGVIFFVCAGYLNAITQHEYGSSGHISTVSDTIAFYEVTLISTPQEKTRSWMQRGQITRAQVRGEWQEVFGKVLLYYTTEHGVQPWEYGTVLLVSGTPEEISPPRNPYEFDYKKFLGYQQIYYQDFVLAADMRKVRFAPPNWLVYWAGQVRAWCEQNLDTFIAEEENRAIAKALVLGVKNELDSEQLKAFSSAGAMHVLAVSGLHVGLIYYVVLLVLKPLLPIYRFRWGILVVSLVVLWGYAFVTGLSPSVLRAATMFSCMALAKPTKQTSDIYITISLSAFVLLLFNPYMIMSVGFQLSFLAVFGIVYFFPKIYHLFTPKTSWGNWLWKITCVSLAAQMTTWSLSLLYFHQFPVYFLLSNALVIPLAFGVLTMGLAVIMLGGIVPWMGFMVGWLLNQTISLLQGVVFVTASLPLSVVDEVYISVFQCWLLFGMFFCVGWFWAIKDLKVIYVLLFLVIIFSIDIWTEWLPQQQKNKLVVYHIPGHQAMDFMGNRQAYFFGDDHIKNDSHRINYAIYPNRMAWGVQQVHAGEESPIARNINGCRVIAWKGLLMTQISSPDFHLPISWTTDIVLLENNAITNLEDLCHLSCQKIIIGSSNSEFLAKQLYLQGIELQMPVYSVLHEGAFVHTF